MAELSIRYANALFELSTENGILKESIEQAIFLRTELQNDECKRIVAHPRISTANKCEFFSNAFSGAINEHLLGFLYLVTARNRENFLIPALTAFIDMGNNYFRKTTAKITSATELDEGQISALKELLSKKLNKHVDISLKVDPSVIGGLYIFVDGYFIDRTIKKRLYDMKISVRRGTANDSKT
ncbi:MAG: ATP synthase F1 subunit delta [Synergistaceae bacterium]|nr:ATP synthase F1 subunit delta [Synergistaceae bacterium]